MWLTRDLGSLGLHNWDDYIRKAPWHQCFAGGIAPAKHNHRATKTSKKLSDHLHDCAATPVATSSTWEVSRRSHNARAHNGRRHTGTHGLAGHATDLRRISSSSSSRRRRRHHATPDPPPATQARLPPVAGRQALGRIREPRERGQHPARRDLQLGGREAAARHLAGCVQLLVRFQRPRVVSGALCEGLAARGHRRGRGGRGTEFYLERCVCGYKSVVWFSGMVFIIHRGSAASIYSFAD